MLRKKLFLLFLLGILVPYILSAQNDVAAGETLFKSRCTSCHAIGKKMIGPDLKNVLDRHDTGWLVKFIHSSQTMVKAGEPAAVALFEENNKITMPDHLDLSEAEVNDILAFIKLKSSETTETKKSPLVHKEQSPYGDESGIWHKILYLNYEGDHKPVAANDGFFWTVLTFFVILLILALLLIVKKNDFMEKFKIFQQISQEKEFNSKTKE